MTTAAAAGEPTAFFSKTFDETLALVIEARDYVAHEEGWDRIEVDLPTRLLVSRETTRLTARLTHMMSWLLFQKAIFAGEIAREEAWRPPYRLSGHAVCLGGDRAETERLPARLRGLLEHSRRLYVRVARLDELAARDWPQGPLI